MGDVRVSTAVMEVVDTALPSEPSEKSVRHGVEASSSFVYSSSSPYISRMVTIPGRAPCSMEFRPRDGREAELAPLLV